MVNLNVQIFFFLSAINGAMVVPTYIVAVRGDVRKSAFLIDLILFAIAAMNSGFSTFLTSGLNGKSFGQCIIDAIVSVVLFFCGGIIPLVLSSVLPDHMDRITFLVGVTISILGVIFFVHSRWREEMIANEANRLNQNRAREDGVVNHEGQVNFPWILFLLSLTTTVIMVFLAYNVNNLRVISYKEEYGC